MSRVLRPFDLVQFLISVEDHIKNLIWVRKEMRHFTEVYIIISDIQLSWNVEFIKFGVTRIVWNVLPKYYFKLSKFR